MIEIQLRDSQNELKEGWFACRIIKVEGTTTPTFSVQVVNEQDITENVIWEPEHCKPVAQPA